MKTPILNDSRRGKKGSHEKRSHQGDARKRSLRGGGHPGGVPLFRRVSNHAGQRDPGRDGSTAAAGRWLCLQAEDEIAAIVSVVGASWGGAKAMTATSGPGFCLMQEGVGLAASVESPCVIVNVQRGGPLRASPPRRPKATYTRRATAPTGTIPL